MIKIFHSETIVKQNNKKESKRNFVLVLTAFRVTMEPHRWRYKTKTGGGSFMP